jgi:hypothetical protein
MSHMTYYMRYWADRILVGISTKSKSSNVRKTITR